MLIALFFFTLATLLLYLSSRALISRLGQLFFRLSRSSETTANLLFFLLLPGVFLHEFSHILSAEILRVPTGRLSLKPQLKDNQLKLGSAQIAAADPFRLLLIGTAPFITGLFSLWALLQFGLNLDLAAPTAISLFSIFQTPPLKLFIVCYLIFALSNTMFSSVADLQSAAIPIILLLLLTGLFQLTSLQLPVFLVDFFTHLFWLLAAIFFLTLLLNLILLALLQLIRFVLH